KLQERELAPSKNAWAKLEAQLQKEGKKRAAPKNWLAVAAIFIGVLLVVSVLVNRNGPNGSMAGTHEKTEGGATENNPLTVEPKIEVAESIENKLIKTDKTETVKVEEIQKNNTVVTSTLKEKEIKAHVSAFDPKKETAAVANTTDGPIEKTSSPNPKTGAAPATSNTGEAVAQAQQLGHNGPAATGEGIDRLLQQAQRGLRSGRPQKPKKIDAAALLSDIELELERSFRDRVFEALSEGFDKIRTAVVERNN
ncbi:MAG: hypothetical protein ACPGQR_03815, partial [Marinirhabdus sp.]